MSDDLRATPLDAAEERAFRAGHEAGVQVVLDALPRQIVEPIASVALAGGFSPDAALAAWREESRPEARRG